MGLITLATKKWCGIFGLIGKIMMFTLTISISSISQRANATDLEFVPICQRSPSIVNALEYAYGLSCDAIDTYVFTNMLRKAIILKPVEGKIIIKKTDLVGFEKAELYFKIEEKFELIYEEGTLSSPSESNPLRRRSILLLVNADVDGSINPEVLAPFREFNRISLMSNNLTKLRKRDLLRLTYVQSLEIVAPRLEVIENGTLGELANLEIVDFLSPSPLSQTHRAAFKGIQVVNGLPVDFDEKERSGEGEW